MFNTKYPFAVRLLGFRPEEAAIIQRIFADHGERGCTYFSLPEDNLQDPDIFLANADEEKALIALSYLSPSMLRPALLIASSKLEHAYPHVARPVKAGELLTALDSLVERRADALAELEASDIVTVPERRRKERIFDENMRPDDYLHLRRPPVNGGVLVVDRNVAFRDYVAELLGNRNIPVACASTEAEALLQCRRQKISIVLMNTSLPDVEPYRLCASIKTQIADRVTVVFLVGGSFSYDQAEARKVGCDGYLEKPVTSKNLMSALKKFLPALWR
ncbi:response regulator [Oxalobacteraceae bacterium R-40]|uniref:Response regulator n=1 Tax=Keguizhuia sedimenti TaxID=3064264 RepID=A0ABU1BLW6_9BURK|nr:response regulator [Oxalobacteraceae bacterium R-40]